MQSCVYTGGRDNQTSTWMSRYLHFLFSCSMECKLSGKPALSSFIVGKNLSWPTARIEIPILTRPLPGKPYNSFELWNNRRNVHISKSSSSQPTLAPFQRWEDLRRYQWLEKLSSLHGPEAYKSYYKYFWWAPCWQQTGPVCQLEGSPAEVQERLLVDKSEAHSHTLTVGTPQRQQGETGFPLVLTISRHTVTLRRLASKFRCPNQMSCKYP